MEVFFKIQNIFRITNAIFFSLLSLCQIFQKKILFEENNYLKNIFASVEIRSSYFIENNNSFVKSIFFFIVKIKLVFQIIIQIYVTRILSKRTSIKMFTLYNLLDILSKVYITSLIHIRKTTKLFHVRKTTNLIHIRKTRISSKTDL